MEVGIAEVGVAASYVRNLQSMYVHWRCCRWLATPDHHLRLWSIYDQFSSTTIHRSMIFAFHFATLLGMKSHLIHVPTSNVPWIGCCESFHTLALLISVHINPSTIVHTFDSTTFAPAILMNKPTNCSTMTFASGFAKRHSFKQMILIITPS